MHLLLQLLILLLLPLYNLALPVGLLIEFPYHMFLHFPPILKRRELFLQLLLVESIVLDDFVQLQFLLVQFVDYFLHVVDGEMKFADLVEISVVELRVFVPVLDLDVPLDLFNIVVEL